MKEETTGLTRRRLLKSALYTIPMALVASNLMLSTEEIMAALPGLLKKPKDPKNLTDFEKLHTPVLDLPLIAEDGSSVPVYVDLPHPMEADHYIKSVDVLFYGDPVVQKGKFFFTTMNSKAVLSTQVRLGASGQVVCISECNKHGKWVGTADVKVTVGGC